VRASLVAACLLVGIFLGCVRRGREGERRWRVRVACPCLMAMAVREALSLFRAEHPRVEVELEVKGQEAIVEGLLRGGKGADVAILVGDEEVGMLRRAGLVGHVDTFCFEPLALLVPEGNPAKVGSLKDLGSPRVRVVGLGAEGTSLGKRAEELLKGKGVWGKVRPKVRRARFQMELVNLTRGGEFQAAIGPASCALASGGKGAGLVALQVFKDAVGLVPCMAVIVKGGKGEEAAYAFVDFLTRREAQEVFRRNGFTPLLEARLR